MGIPKLMKDLAPYTERANLGKKPQVDDAVYKSSVVIDGPSFVYHVYHQQMKSLPQVVSPMAYRDINEGVISLLNEMQKYGVDIKKIYFDGALPVTKRETRLDRLEKHRRGLDYFVKSRVMKSTVRDPLEQPANGEALLQKVVNYPQLHDLKTLEPPFMVASAIEHLRKGRYSSLVKIIPDEAEVGCLLYACEEEVAILSNDSDLLVYPSASVKNLTLVLLHTLEQVKLETGTKVLMADCLRPAEINRQLQISSLHLLAFQRHLDPSASFTMIKQRAKTIPMMTDTLLKFHEFISDYPFKIPDQVQTSASSQSRSVADPRLSELRYQYSDSRHVIEGPLVLHIYLPALFEDPAHESPWAHGSDLRRVAYSLLNLTMRIGLKHLSLLEYQRRGRNIRGVEVVFLSIDELAGAFDGDTGLLQQSHYCNTAEEAMAMWQQLALREVNVRRENEGRANFLPTFHLSACVQAVLYSLRLLKQVWELVWVDQVVLSNDRARILEKLISLPDLAEMMDELRHLHPVH